MDNFTLDELNELVNNNYRNELEFVSHSFQQINASNEASYFVETTGNLVGLVYITDRGEDAPNGRYRMSTDSLQDKDVLAAAREEAANVAREAGV